MSLSVILASALFAAPVAPVFQDDPSDLHARHLELIAAIKKDMKAVDRLLLEIDAKSPERGKGRLDEIGRNVEKLLTSAQEHQAETIDNIEELVRLKNHKSGKP